MNHFKKNKNKLEKLRGIFFQFGLITAGALTLLAFEWTSPNYITVLVGDVVREIEWDYPYVKPFEVEKEQPKQKIDPPKIKHEEIKIVPDDFKEIKEIGDEKEKPKTPEFNPGEFKIIEVDPVTPPVPWAEIMPEFIGGINMMNEYLSENIKYPSKAREIGVQGKVFVQFIVGKDGEIRDIKIIRGVNKWLDEEAIRVVKEMPKWKPGKQSGRPVSVLFNLPINFKLKGVSS